MHKVITLIDESRDTGTQDYRLVRVYRFATGDVVRVTVRRDFYERQSYARAEVLNVDRKWTDLIYKPTKVWYPHTEAEAHWTVPIEVAESLARRAYSILDDESLST
jgi:hypothetical protein